MRRRTVIAALLLAPLGSCANGAPPMSLLSRLRAGGLVLYTRHATTDPRENDQRPAGDFADCRWQRGLTDEGRALARRMGQAVRELHLPIASVVASPMCRTMETARLMYGEPRADRALLGGRTPEGKLDVGPIIAFWKRPPAAGTLVAIVGHESPDLGFKPLLAEGETVVFEPRGDDYRILARIAPAEWPALAAG